MIDIKSLSYEALVAFVQELGEQSFRANQIFKWIHEKKVVSFDEMTNLSKGLIQKLKENSYLTSLEIVTINKSNIDGTNKYLFKLSDGHMIETVLMRYHYGYSICISSQVGCRMGCTFCASTIGGLKRQLSAGEMLEQIYAIEREEQNLCHSVVVMGTGEPFDNFDQLITFIHLLNHSKGRLLGQRHITVSTSGLTPMIKEFADLQLQVNLAISLHSVEEHKRSEIMPINRKYGLSLLKEAVLYYTQKTNRRITFEYTVIEGVNDQLSDAKALSDWTNGLLCHVNLIPLNSHVESDFKSADTKYIKTFKNELEKAHIPVTIRRSLGKDIDAACGQLRHRYGIKE